MTTDAPVHAEPRACGITPIETLLANHAKGTRLSPAHLRRVLDHHRARLTYQSWVWRHLKTDTLYKITGIVQRSDGGLAVLYRENEPYNGTLPMFDRFLTEWEDGRFVPVHEITRWEPLSVVE